MHRGRAVPAGALARVTWTRVPPPAIDQQLEVFREGTLPLIEALPGYCSASLLVERHTGKAVLAVVYDSPEAMAASRVGADQLRVEVMRTTGARLLDVAEFDVVLARLRVPERV
jgi:hypothetical protein